VKNLVNHGKIPLKIALRATFLSKGTYYHTPKTGSDGRKTNYLFAVVDAYDKEPIGDYYGLRCRTDEAVHSLENAVRMRFGSLEPYNGYRVTLRVDQGSQYISKKFRKRAKELGVRLEYCGINCPNDNRISNASSPATNVKKFIVTSTGHTPTRF